MESTRDESSKSLVYKLGSWTLTPFPVWVRLLFAAVCILVILALENILFRIGFIAILVMQISAELSTIGTLTIDNSGIKLRSVEWITVDFLCIQRAEFFTQQPYDKWYQFLLDPFRNMEFNPFEPPSVRVVFNKQVWLYALVPLPHIRKVSEVKVFLHDPQNCQAAIERINVMVQEANGGD